MWQPDPGWQPLPGGMGTSTSGVWLVDDGNRQLVVKRISAPLPLAFAVTAGPTGPASGSGTGAGAASGSNSAHWLLPSAFAQ